MMTNIERAFLRRLSHIPSHGLGLSVDVYSPNLFELLEALISHGLDYGYLEIFQASQSALAEVRRRLPKELLAYHAEGLWLTQPEWGAGDEVLLELSGTAAHLAILGCYWINHECATKQMAGFPFGTYLPPLFTATSADVTAAHATRLQQSFAASGQFEMDREPLVLLEIPPLTYFAFGDMPVTEFFSRIAAQTSCGFVLDLGHVWTYYRYSHDWRRRSMTAFLTEFLDAFPLERVVQIHMAGLAVHESATGSASEAFRDGDAPFWIDAHHAPIPEVLSDMLDQVLAHPKLRALKGLALEVDTKSIAQIVSELTQTQQRFGERVSAVCGAVQLASEAGTLHDDFAGDSIASEPTAEAIDTLRREYERYARVVSGHISASQAGLPSQWLEPGSLDVYRQMYLPHEILHWGGDLHDMFPKTCRQLAREGIDLSAFVSFWFREAHPLKQPYDFFLLKLDRFPRFIREVLPTAFQDAMREADALREAYRTACDHVIQPEEAHT
jgi:uncharacterized protein